MCHQRRLLWEEEKESVRRSVRLAHQRQYPRQLIEVEVEDFTDEAGNPVFRVILRAAGD